MRIHLVAAKSPQGELDLLIEERFTGLLLSYAYRGGVTGPNNFPMVWQALAAMQAANPNPGTDLRARLIVDSGAFTAFTSGKSIDPNQYAEWSLEFIQTWRSQLAELHFMNLDVIGDQDASWVNQAILEGHGLNPMPIITYGAEKRHLVRALDGYEYIALGGLVPYVKQKQLLTSWLDTCFAIVMAHRNKTGVMPKVHLLGVTSEWVLQRYPAFSCDSSSWKRCYRFPGQGAPGIENLPKYQTSEGALAATRHTVRFEIQKLKRIEQQTTKLWTSRGIQWATS